MRRRKFLKVMAGGGIAAHVSSFSAKLQGAGKTSERGMLPRRPLGKTGEYLSIIGLGGVVFRRKEDGDKARVDKIVRDAIEAGVNVVDVAPAYGNAQAALGPALEPFRKNLFLSCKTNKRTKEGSLKELHDSLKILRTDYFDLYQLHYLNSSDDIITAFGKNGAIETLDKAKKEGLVRYVGFSAHTVEAAMEAMENYDFDTILFPINFVSWYKENFGPQVIEYAKRKGMTLLAMKTQVFSRARRGMERACPNCWYQPILDPEDALLALRWALSQPVTTVMPPGDEGLFRKTLDLAHSFIPVTEMEKEYLKQKAQEFNPLFTYPSSGFSIIDR